MTAIELLSKITRRLPTNTEIPGILANWKKIEEEYLEQSGWVKITAGGILTQTIKKCERMFGARYAIAGMRKELMEQEAQNVAAWNAAKDDDWWSPPSII